MHPNRSGTDILFSAERIFGKEFCDFPEIKNVLKPENNVPERYETRYGTTQLPAVEANPSGPIA